LRNTAAKGNRRLGLNLVDSKSNRDAVGARIFYQAEDPKRSGVEVGGAVFFVVTAMRTE
jgi:enediyne biosynthesis protein E4